MFMKSSRRPEEVASKACTDLRLNGDSSVEERDNGILRSLNKQSVSDAETKSRKSRTPMREVTAAVKVKTVFFLSWKAALSMGT